MPTTGEKPREGTYICTKCGKVIVLDNCKYILPPCPKCHGTFFLKR